VRWALTQECSEVLNPRESEVIALRYASSGQAQRSLAEVGRLLGISRERARQIEVKARDRLGRWRERERLNELLEMKVSALRVTPLAKRALRRAGIRDVRALTALSYDELIARLPYPGGRAVAAGVRAVLQELDLSLAGSRYPHHSVESLGLSLPVLAMLKAAGVRSVEALAEMSRRQMGAALERFRRQMVAEVEEALHERGLSPEPNQQNGSTSGRAATQVVDIDGAFHERALSLKREHANAPSSALTPIEVLGLPQLVYGALRRTGYCHVEELEGIADGELVAGVRHFGLKGLEVMRRSIEQFHRHSLHEQ